MLIHACAKINLTLDVLARRADGYHEVDMIMQSVSLCDELHIDPCETLSLSVAGDAPATADNLVLRAARALQEHTATTKGAKLHLVKHIPTAAGLGGGSADAAAALRGLNTLWETNLSLAELCQIGAKLGADIPFCIHGGTMRATGIGTSLTPLPAPPPLGIVIIKACNGMLTKDVYGALQLPPQCRPDTQAAIKALQSGNVQQLCDAMGNALESVTLPARPAAKQAMDMLLALGALTARMSGSGPSVFGLFPDVPAAEKAVLALPDHIGFKTAASFHPSA